MKCPNEGVVGVLLSLLCALFWYMFSIGLTFYNKWLFRTYDLHFPLTVTSWHMVTNFLFSWICRAGVWRSVPL
jgi:solute carrier family 35 protein C2